MGCKGRRTTTLWTIYRFGSDGLGSQITSHRAVTAEEAFDIACEGTLRRYFDGSHDGRREGEDVFAVVPCMDDGRACNGSGDQTPKLLRFRPQPVTRYSTPAVCR